VVQPPAPPPPAARMSLKTQVLEEDLASCFLLRRLCVERVLVWCIGSQQWSGVLGRSSGHCQGLRNSLDVPAVQLTL
jgi:hypothetical protein